LLVNHTNYSAIEFATELDDNVTQRVSRL